MNKKKIRYKIDERKKLEQNLKGEVDERIDELLGRALGTARGALGSSLKNIKNVIGTADDYRFGYRKGYVGAGIRRRSKRAARAGGVANPNWDPSLAAAHVERMKKKGYTDTEAGDYEDPKTGLTVPKDLKGRAAWRQAKRAQADRKVDKGIPGLGDIFRMTRSPEKFKQGYQTRTGEEVPGFGVDAPGGPAQRYGDVTTGLRYGRKARQQAQAKRLAGDPEEVQKRRDLATAREKDRGPFELHPSFGKDRTYFKRKQDQDTDPAYPYTAGTPETKTVRKGVEVPTPPFTTGGARGERRSVDVEVPTGRMNRPRGVSWTGRPISRGGVAWHQVGRGGGQEAPIDVDVERMPRKTTPVRELPPGKTTPRISRGADAPLELSRGADGPAELPGRYSQDPVKRVPSNIALRQKHLDKLLKLRRGGNVAGAEQARKTFQQSRRKKWLPTDAGQLGGRGTDYQRMRAHTEYLGTGSPLSEMLRRRLRHA